MKKGRTVLEAKRYGIYSCRPDDTLAGAAHKMIDKDISALVVADDDGYLTGLISRTDLLRAHLNHDAWASLRVADFMSAGVVTVTPETTLHEVAQLLLQDHIHRVVVVREENGRLRPVSVVSDSDLIYHMCKDSD